MARWHLHVGWFALSPDAQRIVLMASTGPGRDWEIYVMSVDGSSIQQPTDNRAQDEDPGGRPDGTRSRLHEHARRERRDLT